MSSEESLLQSFASLTNTPESVARVTLERNNWDLESAINDFYNGPTHRSISVGSPVTESSSSANQQQSSQTATSSGTKQSNPSKRFKSFQELVNQEDDADDDEQNFFAGGARGSGLEVENPNNDRANANKLVQDLLKKAETDQNRPEDYDEQPQRSHFEGVGNKLGDNDTPSRPVGNISRPKRLEKVTREITFWKDGFQVGNGILYRYDDSANASYLAELNSGRAPMALLDVEYGQDVDVNVLKKLDEEYKPPKRKLTGFHGQGNRLGSVVSPEYKAPEQKEPEISKASKSTEKLIDEKDDEGKVQIRLTDGRKIVYVVDSQDTLSTLYQYVKSQTNTSREFTLNTAFPVKKIENSGSSIKEAGLINSVVVQRWV